jgi:hypothetical protein
VAHVEVPEVVEDELEPGAVVIIDADDEDGDDE